MQVESQRPTTTARCSPHYLFIVLSNGKTPRIKVPLHLNIASHARLKQVLILRAKNHTVLRDEGETTTTN